MNTEKFEIVAKTFQGLEDVLAEEIRQLGGENVETGRRMVSFTGDKTLLYKANLACRTALRILKPIYKFEASDPDEVYEKTMREIIEPTVRGMAEDGIVYTGFLYAGLMIGKDKEGKTTVKTLEFNCRMGDPETQPIMSRIKSGFAQTLAAAAAGDITKGGIEYDKRSALGVVLAARGYPEHPEKGAVITGLSEETDDAVIFHAGTATDANGNIVVSGGRVLCVVGLGDTLKEAHDAAYRTADQVHFDGVQKRRDIGYRAL